MKIDIYAFSSNGAKLCDKIIENLMDEEIEAFVPKQYLSSTIYGKEKEYDLYKSTQRSFKNSKCIIFIGAVGIAVRAISPFVRSKKTDPAVICIDDRGINVISILSGHIGGANQLTRKIAKGLNANPIITTATDINGKFAVDEWAQNKNMHIFSLKMARHMANNILDNNKIGILSDFGIEGQLPIEFDMTITELGICISLDSEKKPFENTLNLIPKIVTVGIGCRKGTDYLIIYDAIKDVLMENKISHFAIKSLNSIDLKKDEIGILRTANIFKVPFYTYTKDELNSVEGEFSKSEFVKSITGTDSVCERASIIGNKKNKLIINKTINNSVTVAASIEEYKILF